MTRDEFIENVTYIGDLIEFCCDNGIEHLVEDVYTEDQLDDYINNNLTEMASDANSWRELRDTLYDIPTGEDYYIVNGLYDISEFDQYDFDRFKRDVLEYCDDDGEIFDEEDEDEEEEEEEYDAFDYPDDDQDEEGDDDLVCDEPFDVMELQMVGVQCILEIDKQEEQQERESLHTLLQMAAEQMQ